MYGFSGCTGLTGITIPAALTSIKAGAFARCTSLNHIAVDSANKNFETDGKALFDKGKLTLFCYAIGLSDSSYTIPGTVTSIWGAFQGCTSLTSIALPASLTSIWGAAFQGCTGLTSIALPASLRTIGTSVFKDCTALTGITLPDGITTIDFSAFEGCTGLTSVVLPAALTTIKGSAFSDCSGLTSIDLPTALTDIWDQAFSGCSNLAALNYSSTKADWAKVTLGWNWHQNCPLLKAVTCTDGPVTL